MNRLQSLFVNFFLRLLLVDHLKDSIFRFLHLIGNITLLNCYLVNFNELAFSGMDPAFVVTISGYMVTNDNMWV